MSSIQRSKNDSLSDNLLNKNNIDVNKESLEDKSNIENKSNIEDKAPVIDFDKFRPTRSSIAARKRKDFLMRVLIFLSFIVAVIPLFSLLYTTIIHGIKRFNIDFLTHNMTYVVGGNATGSGGYGGILHAIIGTLEITFGAMLISIPIGLMCAVYLIEYARGSKIARIINLLVDVMSGIPSIVAGLFAFSMFAFLAGPGTINGFEGSVALSLLMIPTVVKSSQEMLKIVPTDLREAALALGVTKHRMITKVVLRTALPGIVSGCILAVARVIGETAPLLMAAGFIASTNFNLFDGQMTTLPVYVYQEYSKLSANCPANAPASCVTSIPMERAWAAALTLIIVVLLLNIIGRVVARVFSVKAK
ncbi:phosphate ABC transporter permease PstA [Gardnerella vaginalis]|uniref:phosphate ABC transporter permease PstA n=1 Tax=Gardnerella vaginalis TaxID=2702 RepID=UPI0039EE42BE